MAEGTTIAPSVRCSLCDEDDAVKLCNDCYQELCSRCSKAHAKLQSTSHHKLIPIENKGISGARPKSTKAYCCEHTSTPLSIICENCLCALCATCADQDHKTHRLIKTNLDVTLLQRVSAEKVPEFMKLLHQLEKQKDGTPEKLKLYKSARVFVTASRDRLWKIIEQDAENLLDQIDKEIKQQELLLTNIETDMKDMIGSTDRQMTVMGNARKIDDSDTLISNIHEGDQILKRAQLLLSKIESTRKLYTIDDLFPFRSELRSTEESLHTFFTMTQLVGGVGKSKDTSRNYQSMTKLDSLHLGKTTYKRYRISECGQRNSKTVIIYRVHDRDIHVFDTEIKQTKMYKCAKSVFRMATLDEHRHVILDMDNTEVHILDRNFKILNKDPREDGYLPNGLCSMSHNIFILSEYSESEGKTRFTEVRVSQFNKLSKHTLCEINCKNSYGILSIHTDYKFLTINDSLLIHNVHLDTGKTTSLDLSKYIHVGIYYLCVDEAGQILLGDKNGKIYLATSSKYECELQNMKGTRDVGGISIRGDNVIVVEGEYLHIYK